MLLCRVGPNNSLEWSVMDNDSKMIGNNHYYDTKSVLAAIDNYKESINYEHMGSHFERYVSSKNTI